MFVVLYSIVLLLPFNLIKYGRRKASSSQRATHLAYARYRERYAGFLEEVLSFESTEQYDSHEGKHRHVCACILWSHLLLLFADPICPHARESRAVVHLWTHCLRCISHGPRKVDGTSAFELPH